MPFEAAKCPSCGAAIQVPNEMVQARCVYCGSTLIVREAIQKLKIEISGHVNVAGLSSVENDLERARQSMAVKDFTHAYRYYCSAVDKQANNYDAWRGCLMAATANLTAADLTQVSVDGLMGLKSLIDNCVYYVPREQKTYLLRELEQFKAMVLNLANSEAVPKKKTVEKTIREQAKGSLIAGGIFGVIGFVCLDPSISGGILDFFELKSIMPAQIFSWITFAIAGLAVLSGLKIFKRVNIKKFLDPQKMALASYIDSAIRSASAG
jgi:DNA-directed RNA polymerase subunit RPC12/RpoP